MSYSITVSWEHGIPTEADHIIFVKASGFDFKSTPKALADQGTALGEHLFSILPSASLDAMMNRIVWLEYQATHKLNRP